MKDVAARCVLRAVYASKYVCGWGSAPDPTGELTALPDPLAGFQGTREGKEEEKGGEGKGTEERKRGRERRGGEGRTPEQKSWLRPLYYTSANLP